MAADRTLQVAAHPKPSAPTSTAPFLWLILITLPFGAGVIFILVPPADAQDSDELRLGEPYVSAFLTRSSPIGGDISFRGDEIPSLSIDGGTGGGLKVGAYVRPYKRVFGAELDIFGNGGNLTAPRTTNGGATRFVDQNLTLINALLNVLARYPGDLIQPYVGAGAGISLGIFDGDIQSAAGRHGSYSTIGFAAQGLAGVRLKLTEHFFGFAEYKYFVALFDTKECQGTGEQEQCRPFYKFDYQSNYATVGVGFTF